ncbi:MAG: cytochrome P450, partial [Acidimicrobiia bacterium]
MALQVAPRSEIDLFSDEALTDPFPIYRALRDAGEVVYNEPLEAWVLARYSDVRWVMKEWETFTSAEGIAFNELLNMNLRGTVLGSDPPEHDRTRTVMLERLNLKSVRELIPGAERKAEALVTG